MALINPCNIAASVRNTGSECSDALKAAAMICMIPRGTKWLASDNADFTSFMNTKIHEVPALRWLPIFGISAPIRQITESNETDVLEPMEDGSVQFIRYGMYNRTFMTTEGGFCLAQSLMGLSKNYDFIEVDITGQVAMMKNSDGTYSGFPVNLAYAPAPTLANLKSTYKNAFMLSFSPIYYVKQGKVFGSDATEDILSLRGLYDTDLADAGVQTTTNIFVSVKTDCGETDLIAIYGAVLGTHVGNFVIKNHTTGAIVTPTAAAIVSGTVQLTGTYVTATTYDVYLAAPSVLKAAGIEGYETLTPASILIP